MEHKPNHTGPLRRIDGKGRTANQNAQRRGLRKPSISNRQMDSYLPKTETEKNTLNTDHFLQETHKQQARTKRKRGFILWGFVIFYLAFLIIGNRMTNAKKERILETKVIWAALDKPATYNGIAVRDEHIYESEVSGTFLFAVNDGDRVKQGSLLGYVQDSERVLELEKQLQNANNNIIDSENSQKSVSAIDARAKETNRQTKQVVDSLAFVCATGNNVEALYEMKDKVEQIQRNRNQMLLSEDSGSAKTLIEENQGMEMQVLGFKQQVKALSPGIMSYGVDGLESLLTTSQLPLLTKEQTLMSAKEMLQKNSLMVNPKDALFKVVQSNDWYIAAYLPKEQAENLKPNTAKTLYIQTPNAPNGQFSLDTKIKIYQDAQTDSYVVFETNKHLIDFLHTRNISFQLEKQTVTGLRVPNSAIATKALFKLPKEAVFEEKGYQNVIKRTSLGDEIVEFWPLYNDETHVYAVEDFNQLKISDSIVLPTTGELVTIEDTEQVHGIYVTNTGATDFRRIYYEGQWGQNNEFTVLDPNYNKLIGIHDKIVADARFVKDRQLLY